jgi:hypothetical protein
MKEQIIIDKNGRVELPEWILKKLLKASRLRSKRWRKQKKAVKKKFIELLKEGV